MKLKSDLSPRSPLNWVSKETYLNMSTEDSLILAKETSMSSEKAR